LLLQFGRRGGFERRQPTEHIGLRNGGDARRRRAAGF
jgi:hypothetical protein